MVSLSALETAVLGGSVMCPSAGRAENATKCGSPSNL